MRTSLLLRRTSAAMLPALRQIQSLADRFSPRTTQYDQSMSPRADDPTSPAGVLRAAQDALSEAVVEDESWRRDQLARTCADYAAEVWWDPTSTSEQRAEAAHCLRLSYDLDEETKTRHAYLRTSHSGRPPADVRTDVKLRGTESVG